MAVLTILCHPDPRLRIEASPVTIFDDGLQKLAEDMLETMYTNDGIGLAATQVNVHKRMLVIDISEERNNPHIYVNPVITTYDDAEMSKYEEGCLSVPGFREEMERLNHVRIDYQNTKGEQMQDQVQGLHAICIQHECDHLEGKLFIDYLSLLKRERITTKLKKKKRSTA